MSKLLEIKDLCVEFGPAGHAIKVLHNVNLSIAHGEAVGLVGESGSGKSITSLSVLRLLSEPPGRITSGEIVFEGRNLLDLPRSDMPAIRGKEIAMIFQEPMSSLNPVMTIGAQLSEAIMLHSEQNESQRKNRILELLKLVGIPEPEARLKQYPHEFSGGMRQRVMIAMSLACDPKLLIADEPTTALDVTIQAQVLDLLRQLRERVGMAVLLISHDLGVVADVCDRVVVMYAGHVVEDADIASLFENPKHPYTRGLLSAVPSLSDTRERLYQIPGSVPSPGSVKRGCPFYDRCDLRKDICHNEMPQLHAHSSTHKAACWVTSSDAEAVSESGVTT